MKLERIRAASVPELGALDLTLQRGLVGWVGASARERRVITDLLLWVLGLPGGRDADGAPWTGRAPPSASSVRLEVDGAEITVRDREIVLSPDDHGSHPPERLLGLDPAELGLLWAGGPGAGPERLLAEGTRLLAGTRGLGRIEAALTGLGEPVEPPGSPGASGLEPAERARLESELKEVEERLAELTEVPDRLRSLEEELRSLRADAAEVAGDLEAATMDWLRERQDAETHLQTYRDQARELRDRMRELEEAGPEGPCPFCARPLGDHYDEVVAELEDEWERLVQDGSWWRRRREQLELKPDGLQELESRSVRLQAAVEECAERLERCRFDLRERDELRERRRELLEALGRPFEGEAPPRQALSGAEEERRERLVRALRRARSELLDEEETRLLDAAGTFLNRISGGRILGLVASGEGRPVLLEDGRPVAGPTDEDRAATTVALRLALAAEAVKAGLPLGSIVLGESVRGLDPESRLRTVEVLRGLLDPLSQILLVAGDEAVEATPERFDQIIELRARSSGGGIRTVVLPGGVGVFSIPSAGEA